MTLSFIKTCFYLQKIPSSHWKAVIACLLIVSIEICSHFCRIQERKMNSLHCAKITLHTYFFFVWNFTETEYSCIFVVIKWRRDDFQFFRNPRVMKINGVWWMRCEKRNTFWTCVQIVQNSSMVMNLKPIFDIWSGECKTIRKKNNSDLHSPKVIFSFQS